MSLNCMLVQREQWNRNHKMIGSRNRTEKSNITDQEKSKYCKVTIGRNHRIIMH
jgi:hypothetical protein